MLLYIYQADTWCEDCGRAERTVLNQIASDAIDGDCHAAPRTGAALVEALGFDPDGESAYDSGDYPAGPYPAGEADTPQHCSKCNRFLENPLTEDGVNYLENEVETWVGDGRDPDSPVPGWVAFYAPQLEAARRLELERMKDDPAFMAGVRAGLKAAHEGRLQPWEDVKRELGLK